ncbi:MAG: hypothetical protein JOZ29_18785 [Deltaproteobacteria bacterium]|nr:hypothetical protein [Deltaproteobacteria bacterium]
MDLNRLREGRASAAHDLLQQAAETEDLVAGTIDGQEFIDWFAPLNILC